MGSFSRKLKRAPVADAPDGLPPLLTQVEQFAQPLFAPDAPFTPLDPEIWSALLLLSWNAGLSVDASREEDAQAIRMLLGTLMNNVASTYTLNEKNRGAMEEAMRPPFAFLLERRRTAFAADRRGLRECTVGRYGRKIRFKVVEGPALTMP